MAAKSADRIPVFVSLFFVSCLEDTIFTRKKGKNHALGTFLQKKIPCPEQKCVSGIMYLFFVRLWHL